MTEFATVLALGLAGVLTGDRLAGEVENECKAADSARVVGTSPIRKEGRAKVVGEAKYVDDLELENLWFGATVRSTVARARIRSIRFPPTIAWEEFTVVTAADIPGENCIVHLTKDQPCLAQEQVNHFAEPILLLAHRDKARLPAAVAAVEIEYEELPAVFTIEESEAAVASGDSSRVVWGDG